MEQYLECYYAEMDNHRLCKIIMDYQKSKEKGIRVESFVPHAEMISDNLNLNPDNPTIPLRECIIMSEKMFFEEICRRFLTLCSKKSPTLEVGDELCPHHT